MDPKRGALVAAIMGSAVVAVDSTVVHVALPTITDDLGGGLAGQQWIANSYLLTLSSLILISGSLADIYGERRVFTLGVAGFGLASLLCALAPTVELLVVARALQGIAGALLTPASLAIIVAVFPESERGAAIGSWTAWGGIGYLAGPLVGGQIVDVVSWRWVFAINVPLALITLALSSSYVPAGRERSGPRAKVDVIGALLCGLGLAGISFGLIEQPVLGWGDPLVSVPLVAGVVMFAAFIAYELRVPAPMLPLTLFRRRNFSVANVETLLMYGGMAVQGFFLTLFLQQVAGFSALEAGSANVAPTVVMFLLSRRFGALADRYGPRWFMTIGPLLVAAGFLLMLRLDETTSYWTRPDAGAAGLLARPRGHRLAVDRDGPGGRRRERRRHRVGGQQRDRAHVGAARDRGGRRRARRLLRRQARRGDRRAPAHAGGAGAGRRGARPRARPDRPRRRSRPRTARS